ncbi:MAG: hypothetical protein NVSMB29_07190 [Candidatus Dormibacteria bacterium]
MTEVMLLGHGSPDPAACAELLQLRDRVTTRLGSPVRLGVLEFPGAGLPTLAEAFAAVSPSRPVAAQPLILFDGIHGRRDIPSSAEEASANFRLDIRLGSAFGCEDALVDLVIERLVQTRRAAGDVLLFIGRGSSQPLALRQTGEVAMRVAAKAELDHVLCYTGISRPNLAEGMTAILERRPRRVLAVPYLLHTGILVRRANEVLAPLAARAGAELVMLPHIGNGPVLVELVARRLEALL